MRTALSVFAVTAAFTATVCAGSMAKLRPVPFTRVEFHGGFWESRLEVNRRATVPTNLESCQKTGRLRNFAQCAGVEEGPFRGHIFHDSDVYKVLEGVAYSLQNSPDPDLRQQLDRIVGHIAKCQRPDGYVNTYFTMKEPKKRWNNLSHAHELYCAGHMFEAAVAHYQATGERTFLDVATRFADYIDTVFGDGPDQLHGVAGHEEIELALIKLWRATDNDRYLKLAQWFVDARGNAETRDKLFGTYCQDHKPIRQQTEPVGHCVRAMYLYAAVTDLAAITGDAGYRAAMDRLWHEVVEKKMYVTGGIGVQHHGEGFARDYFLPNDEAYSETCAALGMVFWNHRLALLHGQGRFADVVERELYNAGISGVSLDGKTFFYVNPMSSRGNQHRQPWYGCACCPTNVVRFIASVGDYFYAASADGDAATILQYAAGKGTVPLEGGNVTLVQRTGYPWRENVQIIVEPEGVTDFGLRLRIPDWCKDFAVKLDGKALDGLEQEDGFITLRRTWASGDIVDLELAMPVRIIPPHPKVKSQQGRIALARGPVVYCLEDADHEVPVDQIALPRETELTASFEPELLGGVMVLEGQGLSAGRPATMEDLRNPKPKPVAIRAVPYYAWDNREPGRMVVWIPEKPPAPPNVENATVAVFGQASASHCHGADAMEALNDGVVPKSSIDHDVPRFTWWDHRGTTEWVQLTFAKPQKLAKTEVYWFDDTGDGQCRVPKSWRLLAKTDGKWTSVEGASDYGVAKDTFNTVTFEPVTTPAIRLEVQLQPNFSGGILEWRLPE